MKRFVGMLCASTLIAAASISAYDVNIADATIYAPTLSASDEDQFHSAQTVSSFWASWDEKDYAKLDPLTHYHANRNNFGENDGLDATLIAKVAAGSKGLYLYFNVVDDVFMLPPANSVRYQFDAVDFMIDSKSFEEIQTQPKLTTNAGITTTSQQFQMFMGSQSQLPDSMIHNVYDIDNETIQENQMFHLDQMRSEKAIVVKVAKIDESSRHMEMFIPWANLNIGEAQIETDRRIGFCVGYNDRDDAGDLEAALRLKNNADPYGGKTVNGVEEDFSQRILHWGEIVFTQGVTTGVKHAPSAKNGTLQAPVVSSEFYTLRGEKISAKAMADIGSHSIVVQRSVLKNGAVVSQSVPMIK